MRIHPLFSMRHIQAGMVAVVVAVASASTAWAADDSAPSSGTRRASAQASYQGLVEEGLALYKARDYRPAAEKFLQAYVIDQDSNLLFNLARCYEALGEKAAAIEKYEAYLADPNIEANGKERAERAIRDLSKTEKRPTLPANRTNDGASNADTAVAPAARGNAKVVIGWIATGVLATGTVVTGILAMDSASRLRNARDVFPGNETDIDRLSTRTLALSVTADALGVATAVMGGLSLYWTLASSPSQPKIRAAIGPTGLSLAGSF